MNVGFEWVQTTCMHTNTHTWLLLEPFLLLWWLLLPPFSRWLEPCMPPFLPPLALECLRQPRWGMKRGWGELLTSCIAPYTKAPAKPQAP